VETGGEIKKNEEENVTAWHEANYYLKTGNIREWGQGYPEQQHYPHKNHGNSGPFHPWAKGHGLHAKGNEGRFKHAAYRKWRPGRLGIHMSVLVKFRHVGVFHTGDSLSIDLSKISEFKITRQRNSCELLAITPENHQPDKPYSIATRDREYQLQEIMTDLRQLKKEKRDITYEITDTGVQRTIRA
jgi:hypothetical protein